MDDTINEISLAVMQEVKKQIGDIQKEYEEKLCEGIIQRVKQRYQNRIDSLEKECQVRKQYLDALERGLLEMSKR